jgi:nucleotide-binding universal stress UspA family protein
VARHPDHFTLTVDAMNFSTLLVHLDRDGRCDARSHLAARFAAKHASHLVGIAPTGLVELPPGFAASRAIADADASRAEAIRCADELAARFQRRCADEGAESVEAHVHEGDKAAVLLHHAQCADLVVIGQADPDGGAHREQERFVEQVLLHNPRPTLVVPHAGRFDAIGQSVLVAWDDSPGCARAVADALPLLRHARQVHVRLWHRPGEGDAGPIADRMHGVRRWLMRQGVPAEVQVIAAATPIGDAILHTAADLGADLVVMGTYGHSRWTERLLGGATRTALARSAVPLLMSH